MIGAIHACRSIGHVIELIKNKNHNHNHRYRSNDPVHLVTIVDKIKNFVLGRQMLPTVGEAMAFDQIMLMAMDSMVKYMNTRDGRHHRHGRYKDMADRIGDGVVALLQIAMVLDGAKDRYAVLQLVNSAIQIVDKCDIGHTMRITELCAALHLMMKRGIAQSDVTVLAYKLLTRVDDITNMEDIAKVSKALTNLSLSTMEMSNFVTQYWSRRDEMDDDAFRTLFPAAVLIGDITNATDLFRPKDVVRMFGIMATQGTTTPLIMRGAVCASSTMMGQFDADDATSIAISLSHIRPRDVDLLNTIVALALYKGEGKGNPGLMSTIESIVEDLNANTVCLALWVILQHDDCENRWWKLIDKLLVRLTGLSQQLLPVHVNIALWAMVRMERMDIEMLIRLYKDIEPKLSVLDADQMSDLIRRFEYVTWMLLSGLSAENHGPLIDKAYMHV